MALTTMPNGLMPITRQWIDDAAFGVIYGSIAVMAQLMAMHPPFTNPGRHALVLFGSVFAMALAKAVAEVCERMIETGEAATWADARLAWQHSQTILIAANGPTLAFVLATLGVLSTSTAYITAQILAIGLLGWFGGRIGLRVGGTRSAAFLAAGVTSALAIFVSVLKSWMH